MITLAATLFQDRRKINARLRMAEIARTVTKTRFARFTSTCRVFTHPSSFGTSVDGESSIPPVGDGERMQYSRRQPRRSRRLSRVPILFEIQFDILNISPLRARYNALTKVASNFRASRYKTFARAIQRVCKISRAICSSQNT